MARYEMKDSVSFEALLKMISAAQSELSELCHGKRFRMSVPVEDTDSDMVIGDALRHAKAFIKATEQYLETK